MMKLLPASADVFEEFHYDAQSTMKNAFSLIAAPPHWLYE